MWRGRQMHIHKAYYYLNSSVSWKNHPSTLNCPWNLGMWDFRWIFYTTSSRPFTTRSKIIVIKFSGDYKASPEHSAEERLGLCGAQLSTEEVDFAFWRIFASSIIPIMEIISDHIKLKLLFSIELRNDERSTLGILPFRLNIWVWDNQFQFENYLAISSIGRMKDTFCITIKTWKILFSTRFYA